jgi:hypothetical protein
MTRWEVRAIRGGGDDAAYLHLVICDHHTIYQQLHQHPLLLEIDFL